MPKPQTPIIFINGIVSSRIITFPLIYRLRQAGFTIHVLHLGIAAFAKLETLSFQAHKKLQKIFEMYGGRNCDIIGYSLGGIVAFYCAALLGDAKYIRKLITLGSPFRGSPPAGDAEIFLGNIIKNLKEISPQSPVLEELRNRNLPTADFTCISGSQDHICPIAIHPSAKYIYVPTGHLGLVTSKICFELICILLRD